MVEIQKETDPDELVQDVEIDEDALLELYYKDDERDVSDLSPKERETALQEIHQTAHAVYHSWHAHALCTRASLMRALRVYARYEFMHAHHFRASAHCLQPVTCQLPVP